MYNYIYLNNKFNIFRWRWAFFINFPLCLAAGIIIYFQLNMPSKHVSSSFFEKLKKIDFIGTFLLVGSIVSILLALTWGGKFYCFIFIL